jgi:type I site-specific restriction endonuclease
VIRFTDARDPAPRSRELFHFFRPAHLAGLLGQPDTLRRRLAERMLVLPERNLRDCQVSAVTGLEQSLALSKPRALVHMATGAGKTFTAITSVYRLLKFGGAKRVLFLVDTRNLGKQTKILPTRKEVPKTLIFAKTDSHADDIIQMVREVYGQGNAFCKKVTYRSEEDADTILANFRNDYHPRIAVTVDMIATGTDVKPLEVLHRAARSAGRISTAPRSRRRVDCRRPGACSASSWIR